MLYQNGNTLGNNGFLTAGQIAHAATLKVGDRVRYTLTHKTTLRDAKLNLPTDDDEGVIVQGGLPNGVFVIGWDRGVRGMVHADFLERVPAEGWD